MRFKYHSFYMTVTKNSVNRLIKDRKLVDSHSISLDSTIKEEGGLTNQVSNEEAMTMNVFEGSGRKRIVFFFPFLFLSAVRQA